MKKTIVAFILITLSSLTFSQKQFTLEDVFSPSFSPQRIHGIRSMKDGQHYTTLSSNSNEQFIVKYEYKTGNAVDTLLKSSWLIENTIIDNYQFNHDESKILVSSEAEPIYRHSTKENYYLYDLKTKRATFISQNGKQMYAEFSPDGSKVGFVRDNNLYVYDIASAKETAITNDGKPNHIINGATDWVYEEEFSFDKAWQWSPDGNYIAYYRFDESNVKEFNMQKYGTLYPSDYRFKYPKAGEDNSKVEIYVYDLKQHSSVKVNFPSLYEYFPRIKWIPNAPLTDKNIGKEQNMLTIMGMNRLQNKLDLLIYNVKEKTVNNIISETSDTYIEVHDNLTFLSGRKEFLWTSERSGYNHIYLYTLDGDMLYPITHGKWDVIEIKGVDQKNDVIYYTSTEISPTQKSLYSVTLDGKVRKKLSPVPGTDDAQFSNTCSYYIHSYSNANRPPVIVLRNADGSEVRTLEDNTDLLKNLNGYALSTKEFFNFKTSNGTELNGWMMKPYSLLSEKKNKVKFPVLMFVYGGPGSNTVKDTWDRDFIWYQYLCQQGYMIVSVDNRGTGGRGKKFRDCTYGQLGKLETEDQIEAAKYLSTLPYVDKKRIGIWGWSYGGYMSLLCILKGADYFKMAISVAPVTNWRYYDNIYTERYMGLPKDNGNGYDDNSPINHVEKLNGKLLLVHGTGDDNVHFQNTVEMASALQKANKQFDLMIYPDKNHSMSSHTGNSRKHLYQLMTNYILKNL